MSSRRIAVQCLIDWYGCTIAGSTEPLSRILREEYRTYSGTCRVVGSDMMVPAQVAALVNGCQGHALDYDDTSTVMGGHPSAPVIPAVLAQAEELGSTGEALLVAIVVGIEVESHLGTLIGSAHYASGWHVTSTMGVFGAAAGVGRLLGLDKIQFGHAMGLAASQASGLKANFGTMTKPFHAGHAAERGLLSARLAARGYTANADSFSGNQGLISAAGAARPAVGKYRAMQDMWLTDHVLFKYHAACYLTHASIECLLTLGNAINAESDEMISVTVHPSLLDVCGIPQPRTGLEAKFSLTATSALAILGYDTADPGTYSDALFENAAFNDCMNRVTVSTDDQLKTTQARVNFADQEVFRDSGIPATDLDLQQARLEKKFHNLVRPILGDLSQPRLDQLKNLASQSSVATTFI